MVLSKIQFTMMNRHPKEFNINRKKIIINQNIYCSRYGTFRDCCPTNPSIRFFYKLLSPDPKISNSGMCKILVKNQHALNGLTESIPAIMYPMGNFLGTNFESFEGIYDENIILRTNYPAVIGRQNELFHPDESNIIYSNPITIIRNENYEPLNQSDVYKVAVITSCHTKKNDLTDFKTCIETVFQAAFACLHNVLILTPFAQESGISYEDQANIFYILIQKYGHNFKEIIICVPLYENKSVYDLFNEKFKI